MENVSRAVKGMMVKSGKKQHELATYLGMSESALSHKLKRGTFNRDTMIKIAKFFNVDLTMFSPGDGNRSSGSNITKGETNEQTIENLERLIAALNKTIETQQKTIETLEAALKK